MSPAIAISTAHLENGYPFYGTSESADARAAFYQERLRVLRAIENPDEWQLFAIELATQRLHLIQRGAF